MAEGRALPFDGPRLVLLEETRTVYSSSPCAAPAHCTARWRRYAHRVTALPAWRFGLAALRFRSRRRMCACTCTLYCPNLIVSSVGVCGTVISRIRLSRFRDSATNRRCRTLLLTSSSTQVIAVATAHHRFQLGHDFLGLDGRLFSREVELVRPNHGEWALHEAMGPEHVPRIVLNHRELTRG